MNGRDFTKSARVLATDRKDLRDPWSLTIYDSLSYEVIRFILFLKTTTTITTTTTTNNNNIDV